MRRRTNSRTAALPHVLLLLLAAGWAANHFSAVIAVLRASEQMPRGALEQAFGIYALGLLPSLLGGGAVSDRLGRKPVVLAGTVVPAGGNLLMLAWHSATGIGVGRLVVGLGVGLAISAGTAWAADLAGRLGATLAGITLTAGFAVGPLVSGLLGQFLDGARAVTVPFATSVALSLLSIALVIGRTGAPPVRRRIDLAAASAADGDLRTALGRSIPMALWVFAPVTIPIIVLVAAAADEYSGSWLPGVVSALSLGCGMLAQVVARRQGWNAWSGVLGAGLAAAGFCVAATTMGSPSLPGLAAASVVLGTAYGLCLRDGLVDIESLSPSSRRGTALGIFYVVTYLGFGLPALLDALQPVTGSVLPMLVLAVAAALSAAVRAHQLRREAATARQTQIS